MIKHGSNLNVIEYKGETENEALEIFKQGEFAWNDWIFKLEEENPNLYLILNIESNAPINRSLIFDQAKMIEEIDGQISHWPCENYYFPKGQITFYNCTFIGSYLNFSGMSINCTYLTFENCIFRGVTDFDQMMLNNSVTVKYINCRFERDVSYRGLQQNKTNTSFIFDDVSFEDGLYISSEKDFTCVIDLVKTKFIDKSTSDKRYRNYRRPVSLQGYNCKPISHFFTSNKFPFFEKIFQVDDLARLDVLREIAEENNDFDTAQRLQGIKHALKRWSWDQIGLIDSIFDSLFSLTTGYGRSAGKPLLTLIILSIFFSVIYAIPEQSNTYNIEYFVQNWSNSWKLSAINSFPFFPGSFTLKSQLISKLDNVFFANSLIVWSTVQGVISLILIFLIGLGFRNRYKIKF